MNKIDKLDKELEKAREKAAEWQAKIRELEKQKHANVSYFPGLDAVNPELNATNAMYHPELWTAFLDSTSPYYHSYGHVLSNAGLLDIFYIGVKAGLYPSLIFMGVGAMTDFGPLIADPKSLLLGAAAQLGVFVAFFGAICLGFTGQEAASIGAIACMMFTGNYAFLKYLGEDGVAAFSVACYCFPLVFMVGNAIAQSVQPIISYNHGAGLFERVQKTFHLSLKVAVIFGVLATAVAAFCSNVLVSVFVSDTTEANHLACFGMRYFSAAFLLFSVNLVCIGYYQSLEQYARATLLMLLRGAIFVVPAFLFLPEILGVPGLWLAVPISEALTFLIMVTIRK